MCSILPDSGLIGFQTSREGDPTRTRRIVNCLLSVYVLIPEWWRLDSWRLTRGSLGCGWVRTSMPETTLTCYARGESHTLGRIGGVFKVVGVVGFRTPIGLAAVAGGVFGLGLSYWLGSLQGLAGLAESSVITTVAFSPIGLSCSPASTGSGPSST